MPIAAFALVLAAAVLHAVWNLAAKRAAGNLGVFWLGLCLAGLLLAPFAVLAEPSGRDAAGLPYLLATAAIHTVYFSLLAAAYRRGQISVVYPLARGTGVAGTALVAWAFLGESLSAAGAAGILAVCAGTLLLGAGARGDARSALLAFLVGLTITGYSAVDKLGVRHFSPVIYVAGLAAGTAVLLAPYVLLARRRECLDAWRRRKGQSLWVGLGSVGTYLLVLWAFQQAPASYVVAVRESSVVLATLLGVVVLKEPMTWRKGVSVAAIAVGVVLIKVA